MNGFSYRPNERKLINQILTAVQETAINKVHGLLLLHINRLPVPHDLAYEIKQILPICVRLLHSLVDIITSLGYLKPLILNMQICQMLVQAMWINDAQILQILDQNLVHTLEESYKIKEISEFVEMD